MNGVHDLGGMHGFGPIERVMNEPNFHAVWEARVTALRRLAVGKGFFNLDAFRFGIERMDPAHYLRASYYERMLTSIEYNLIEQGILSPGEIDAKTEHLRSHPDAIPTLPDNVAPPTQTRISGERLSMPHLTPRFAVGDAVVTRNIHPTGHTRLPRYVCGKRGVIHLVHGPEIFPDTHAHGLGEHPQVVYSVRFDARDLWGASAEPRQFLYIDLWESYLDPAEGVAP